VAGRQPINTGMSGSCASEEMARRARQKFGWLLD
jgi:hypothetical protein